MATVPTFVDLQGFVVNGKFTVKEVAVLRRGTFLSHYTFGEPTSWALLTERDKKSARWLMDNHHRLKWEDGYVPYTQAENLIRAAVCCDEGQHAEGQHDARRGTDENLRRYRHENRTPVNDDGNIIYVKGLDKKQWLRDILEEDWADNVQTIDMHYSDIARLSCLRATRALRCGRRHSQCALENVLKLHDWWLSRNK